jgi:Rad3-related DNA helicase
VLWSAQRQHIETAARERRVAAYGANGCGKTFDDALLALYCAYVEGALVVVTSAREGQLRDQFMRDVKVLWQQSPDLDGEVRTLGLQRPIDESGKARAWESEWREAEEAE